MPGILSVGRLLGGSILGFSPRSLFAASEPGGWYDPSDLTTLFQDAAGTTPVTAVEQPVGLVLDKSRGLVLGSELVSNGTFDANINGWVDGAWSSGSASAVSGEMVVVIPSGAAYYRKVTAISVVVGKTYILTGNVRLVSGSGSSLLGVGTSSAGISPEFVASNGRRVFTATAATMYVSAGNPEGSSSGYSLAFDNISVRELPGSHLSQSTSTARPVLSARVNLLTYTEQFDNAAWTEQNIATISAGTTTAPDGTSTAETITASAGAGNHNFYNTTALTTVSSLNYTVSVAVKKNTARYVYMKFQGTVTSPYIAAVFDLDGGASSATQTATAASGSITSTSQEALGNGWFRLTMVGSLPQPTTYVAFGFAGAATGNTFDSTGNVTFTAAGTESVYLWGADLRPSNAGVGLPSYQRVGAATYGVTNPTPASGNPDYDTTGFPLYLKFDGTDDFLVSGTINPGSVDKAQVFAGVRRMSDAAWKWLVQYGSVAPSNQSFGITMPDDPNVGNTGFYARGTSTVLYSPTGNASPKSLVVASLIDLAGASKDTTIIPRINGTVSQSGGSGTTSGGGNFGSYAIGIGASTSSPNVQLYSLILRFSAANLDAATIAATETWVNSKTRAY